MAVFAFIDYWFVVVFGLCTFPRTLLVLAAVRLQNGQFGIPAKDLLDAKSTQNFVILTIWVVFVVAAFFDVKGVWTLGKHLSERSRFVEEV